MNFASLNASRQRLVRLMGRVGYGRLDNPQVAEGDPVWQPAPHVVHYHVLGKASRVDRPPRADFALRQQLVDLFALFDRCQTLDFECIEVQDGLPFRLAIRETAEG